MREAENMNSESTFLSDLSIDYYEFRSSDCCLIPICLLRSVSLSVPPPSPARQGTMCVPAYSIYTVPFHPAEEDTQRLRIYSSSRELPGQVLPAANDSAALVAPAV